MKSAKHHLKRIVGDAHLNFEEVYTVLIQIESVLNSRPLTSLSNDPNDLSYLTPGHFLVGDALTSISQEDVQTLPFNRLSRWQRINQVYQQFWRRWSKEYLSQFQQYNKWQQPKGLSLAVGNMVLLQETESLPLKWSIGRIEDIHPGANGLVCIATVRTAKDSFKRTISKLSVLPLETSDI